MAAHVELRFTRRNTWPAGTRYVVLWNGQRAANGDGIPPKDPSAPVDEANPLTEPIAVWPVGKAGIGDEPAGEGVVGEPSNYALGMGAGEGEVGAGEAGLYSDTITWSTRSVLPTLRDGRYKFALRLEDEHGTVQTDALEVITVTVEGPPRPPSGLQFAGFSEGAVQLAWSHSPDLL